MLNLAVKIERKHLAEDKDWIDSDDEDDEPDETTFDKQLEQFEEGSEEWEQRKDELMEEWRDAYFERQKKKRIREKTRNPQSGELGFAAKPLRDSVAAHAPHFPFERAEQWMVLLVDSKAPDRDLPRSRAEMRPSSARRHLVEIVARLRARAPPLTRRAAVCRRTSWSATRSSRRTRGSRRFSSSSSRRRRGWSTTRYTRCARRTSAPTRRCDARRGKHPPGAISAHLARDLGASRSQVLFKKMIQKKRDEEVKTAAELAEDEDEEDEEEEEEEEGKWYYLGGNSVGELILNIIALGIAGVMLFNFLYARGWWQKFCQPLLDWLLDVSWPLLTLIGGKLHPGWLWFSSNVYDFRHVAFMFENMTAANDTLANATLSTRVVQNDTSFLNEDPFKPNLYQNPYGGRDEL